MLNLGIIVPWQLIETNESNRQNRVSEEMMFQALEFTVRVMDGLGFRVRNWGKN